MAIKKINKIKLPDSDDIFMLSTAVAENVGISKPLMKQRISRDGMYKTVLLQRGYYIQIDDKGNPIPLNENSKHSRNVSKQTKTNSEDNIDLQE